MYAHRLQAAGASLHHYLRITVEGPRLTALAVTLDGDELDRCVLGPPPPPPEEEPVNPAPSLTRVP